MYILYKIVIFVSKYVCGLTAYILNDSVNRTSMMLSLAIEHYVSITINFLNDNHTVYAYLRTNFGWVSEGQIAILWTAYICIQVAVTNIFEHFILFHVSSV